MSAATAPPITYPRYEVGEDSDGTYFVSELSYTGRHYTRDFPYLGMTERDADEAAAILTAAAQALEKFQPFKA